MHSVRPLGALVVSLASLVHMPVSSTAVTEQSALFSDSFDTNLDRWDIHGEGAVAIGDSGDPRHGRVLTLTPNGDVAALDRGSEKWGPLRVEGEMMFPSPVDNYLGFLYNFTARGRRQDFGLIYVKGNDS